jgi:hypothetical protein
MEDCFLYLLITNNPQPTTYFKLVFKRLFLQQDQFDFPQLKTHKKSFPKEAFFIFIKGFIRLHPGLT